MSPIKTLEMQKRIQMRPTLLIGLGGTGQKVLVQLKARFLRNFSEVPEAVRFLCFDTDQTADKTQLDGKVISLTADTELVNVGGIEVANILRNLDKYPAIAAWITEDKERIPVGAIVMGARQVRPLGRLSFFWKVELMYNKIKEAVDFLTRMKELPSEQRGVNVYIVSSVCGGTGSGAILDTAYLARQAINRSGITSAFCFINAYLCLPSVFPRVEKMGIESNAFATLQEIDHFIEIGEWKMDYGNPRVSIVEFSGQPPFNICYLIDTKNEQGQGLAGLDEIAPMIAEQIYLQIGSQVGAAGNSVFDNVNVLANVAEDKESGKYKRTAFSSFGTASLVFPAQKIIDTCANRLGAELIRESLLRKVSDPGRVDSALTNFMQASQLEPETLLQQVARDAKGNLIRIMLDPKVLDRFKESEVLQASQQYTAREESRVDNEYNQALEINKRGIGDFLTQKLDAELNRLADDSSFGLTFSLAFLEKLDGTLARIRTDMDKARAEFDVKKDRALANTRQAQMAYGDSFKAGPIGKANKIKDSRNRYILTFQEYLSARFESRKRDIAISLMATLSTIIQGKRAALQGTIDRLQFIQNKFETFTERVDNGKQRVDYILLQEISTDADTKRYYKEHYERLGSSPVSGLLEAQGPLHSWFELEEAGLSDRILTYTRSVFEDINAISIEQIIMEKKNEMEPEKRLFDLINRSVPFWMYQTAGVLGADWSFKNICIIGVPDQDHSLYVDINPNLEGTDTKLASTFDPHIITVMQTKHGVPLFALTQYKDFKQAHDHVLKTNLKPLYVFPEVRPGGELAKQVFALGMAYGFIFKSGTLYFIQSLDPAFPPTRLGQGMGEALGGFRNNEELIRQVNKQAEDQIARDGISQSTQTLESFIAEPYIFELKGGATAQKNITVDKMTRDATVSKPGNTNFDLVMELRATIKDYVKKVIRG